MTWAGLGPSKGSGEFKRSLNKASLSLALMPSDLDAWTSFVYSLAHIFPEKLQELPHFRDRTLEGFLTPTTTGETRRCEASRLAWLPSWSAQADIGEDTTRLDFAGLANGLVREKNPLCYLHDPKHDRIYFPFGKLHEFVGSVVEMVFSADTYRPGTIYSRLYLEEVCVLGETEDSRSKGQSYGVPVASPVKKVKRAALFGDSDEDEPEPAENSFTKKLRSSNASTSKGEGKGKEREPTPAENGQGGPHTP